MTVGGIDQVNVLSYDYRGYGLHPGVPTEASCYADVEGAYDLLTKEFKIPPSRIILYTIIIVVSALSARSALTLTPLVSLSTPLDFQIRSVDRLRADVLSGPAPVRARASPKPTLVVAQSLHVLSGRAQWVYSHIPLTQLSSHMRRVVVIVTYI
jgi:hypothetical protein